MSERSVSSPRSAIDQEGNESKRSEFSFRSVIAVEETAEDSHAEKNITTIEIVSDQLSQFVLRTASDHIKRYKKN